VIVSKIAILDRKDILTTANVQGIVRDLVIARSHPDVKRGARGLGMEAVSWTIEASYIGRGRSVHGLREPWGALSSMVMSLSEHTGPWNEQSVVVAWQRLNEGRGVSQAFRLGEEVLGQG